MKVGRRGGEEAGRGRARMDKGARLAQRWEGGLPS